MSSIIAHYRSLIAHLGFISGVFATFPFKFNRFSYFELKTTVFSTLSAIYGLNSNRH